MKFNELRMVQAEAFDPRPTPQKKSREGAERLSNPNKTHSVPTKPTQTPCCLWIFFFHKLTPPTLTLCPRHNADPSPFMQVLKARADLYMLSGGFDAKCGNIGVLKAKGHEMRL